MTQRDLVQLSGPLFDANVPRIVDDWIEGAFDGVANLAQQVAVEELDKVLKTQTPFYTTQVKATARSNRAASADVVLDDSGVVYGPWLAGTGSRNATTRFKGYNHWRRTAQRLQTEAAETVVKIVPSLVRKLGG